MALNRAQRRHTPRSPAMNDNGVHHGPPPPVMARPVEPIYVWLRPLFRDENEAAGSQYSDDWYFLYWKNHPMKFRRRFFGNTEEQVSIATAMTAIVKEHNGWTWPDEDGVVRELPATTSQEFWDAIPMDLMLAMFAAISNDITGPLPNSPTRTLETSVSISSSDEPAATPLATPSPGLMSEVS